MKIGLGIAVGALALVAMQGPAYALDYFWCDFGGLRCCWHHNDTGTTCGWSTVTISPPVQASAFHPMPLSGEVFASKAFPGLTLKNRLDTAEAKTAETRAMASAKALSLPNAPNRR